MKKIKPLISLIAIITLVTSFVVYRAIHKKSRVSDVKVINPTKRTIERKLVVPGYILPSKEIQVKSVISGVLEELYINIGDQIKKGDKLAKITIVSDPLTLDKLDRDFQISSTKLEVTRLNFERNKTLYESKSISKKEFEEVTQHYEVTLLENKALERELLLLREGISDKISDVIYSTSDGTILELPIKIGGSVTSRNNFNEGTTIATIANLNSLVFQGKVLESDIALLKIGMKLNISLLVANNITLLAELFMISPRGQIVDGASKFDIYANVVIPSEKSFPIRAGYSGNAEIITERKDSVLSIEEKYLIFKNDSTFVEVVTQDGENEEVYLQTGLSDGHVTEVISGLTPSTNIKWIN